MSLAFYQTYGIREDFSAHRAARINVGGYRFSVHSFHPADRVCRYRPAQEVGAGDLPSQEQQRLDAAVTQMSKDNHWDEYRKKAGIGTYSLAGLIFVLPKIGPLKLVAVKGPTVQTETLYVHSLLDSVDALDHALRRFTPPPPLRATADEAAAADKPSSKIDARPAKPIQLSPAEQRDPVHPLINRDLDTGAKVQPAGYRLTDNTYASLLHRIVRTPSTPIPPGIKTEIADYYANSDLPFATKQNPSAWASVKPISSP